MSTQILQPFMIQFLGELRQLRSCPPPIAQNITT
jgi:hypothetical protein